MATIGLVCRREEDRRDLQLLAGEAGHLVCGASGLLEAVEVLRERRPRLFLVVDESGEDAQAQLRELLRAAPLLPVVIAQRDRDAARAVALLRAGATEVIAPPWTREQIAATLTKSLRFQGTAFSVAPPRPRRSAYAFAFAAVLFFASALAVSSLKRADAERRAAGLRRDHWDLPFSHPSAMAFDGASLWIADWFTQSIYLHDPGTLAVRRLAHFPAETSVALGFGGDAVWTAAASGAIERRMKDASLELLDRYPAAAGTLGLAFDGLYLWTCDARAIYKRLPDSRLSVVAAYRYPGSRAAALAFDGKTLWSLDAGNRELVRHNLERPDEATGRAPLAEYKDGRYKPVGLAWDGGRFWTVGERRPAEAGVARVFRHAPIELP